MKPNPAYLSIGIVSVLFAALVGGRMPYFLFYFYILSLLLPLIHCHIGKRWIVGQLELPADEVVAGEEIKIKYSISNPLPFSFSWLELENEIAYRLAGKREETLVFPLPPKGSLRGEVTAICRRRGLYEVGTLELRVRDVLNIFVLKKTITEPILLKVFPQITTLSNFKIKASQQMGDLLVRDPLFQDISEISEIRQYQTGDSTKKIHWPATARRDELMIKSYEQKGDSQILLLLDSYSKSYLNDIENWVEDKLVETSASIIEYCLKRNIQLTLCRIDEGKHKAIKGDNPQYLKSFLQELVLFRPTGSIELCQQAEIAATGLQQGATLIFLTPQLSKALGTQGILLKQRNINPIFIAVGDNTKEDKWQENKSVGKRLELEGIQVYYIDLKQDIRAGLEGKYEKGA